MKYLICGLGNPGSEYENTRHNIGFKVLDHLAVWGKSEFKNGRLADVATIKHKGRSLIIIKPTTYMNLSGKAIQYWLQSEKIPIENCMVVTDDLALPFGTIRIRAKGSDGGHNGLKNANEVLGTPNYPRLRFGIGSEFSKGQQVDYVLSAWNKEEKEAMTERLTMAAEAILSFSAIGIAQTMANFNNK